MAEELIETGGFRFEFGNLVKCFDISCLVSRLTLLIMKMPSISHQTVQEIRNRTPRRICFASTHQHEPKRVNKQGIIGSFSVPFSETIKPVFEADTKLRLFPNTEKAKFHKGQGFFRTIKAEEEFHLIEQWVAKQKTRVFLCDCLDLSIALDMNFTETNESQRTVTGQLEYCAKYNQDQSAIEDLGEICAQTILDLPYYRDADYVIAVPPTPEKTFDLPSHLAKIIAAKVGKPDLTGRFVFNGSKVSLKNIALQDKWSEWEKGKLEFKGRECFGKRIILIDDLYQSGISIQYVALKLQQAGGSKVFGLSLVKSWNDADNQ